VPDFEALLYRFERTISVLGRSAKTYESYARHIAGIALHYGKIPTLLDPEQVHEYLFMLQKRSKTPSQTYFKHTVYGLRFLLKSEGLEYKYLHLPAIKGEKKLPVVLSKAEVWAMLKSCTLLKHKVLIGLLYGCGLRCMEVRSVRLADLDFDRLQLKVVQGKGKKDRYVPYFHVVFTLPDVLNSLAIYEPKAVYDALLASSWQTLNDFGGNKGVQMGMISILHTWGQTLSLHPHVHCIVPGGGVNGAGEWQNIRCDGKFLFSVKAMSKVFRAKYVAILSQRLHLSKELRASMFAKPWVVYAKRPFGSPKSVVEYLGRYTHKIAISNHRIQAIDKQTVSFLYKDYKQNGQKKTMTLSHCEFVRRFSLHILPKRFTSSVRLSARV
jgi:site-specific recombinase XerC